jgi:hypothetical protein
MSVPTFSAWLEAQGLIPEGVQVPAHSGVSAVMGAVGRQTGPGRDDVLALYRDLGPHYARFAAETGTPMLVMVRAQPLPNGPAEERLLAGALAGALS